MRQTTSRKSWRRLLPGSSKAYRHVKLSTAAQTKFRALQVSGLSPALPRDSCSHGQRLQPPASPHHPPPLQRHRGPVRPTRPLLEQMPTGETREGIHRACVFTQPGGRRVMGKPMSVDLRERVVAAVGGGMRQHIERDPVDVAGAALGVGAARAAGRRQALGADRRTRRFLEARDARHHARRVALAGAGCGRPLLTRRFFAKAYRITCKKRAINRRRAGPPGRP